MRTVAWARKLQYAQPVFGSRACTSPVSLAMKSRLPTSAGCARADVTLAKPKAHFSFSFGRSLALMPPSLVNRVLLRPLPHPFHSPLLVGPRKGEVVLHRVTDAAEASSVLPPRNSATARRSASLSATAWIRIFPFSSAFRIASGVRRRSASTLGFLACCAASAAAWQVAQFA